MKTVSKEVRAVHYGNTSSPLVEVKYFKSDEMFIILNESREMLVVNQQNIPALIAML